MNNFLRYMVSSLLIISIMLVLLGPSILYAGGGAPKKSVVTLDKAPSGKNSEKFQLYFPNNNLIIDRDSITIKGLHGYGGAVFINGIQINIRDDGRFFHSVKLSSVGKYRFTVSYVAPNYEVFHITRDVIRVFPVPKNGVNNRLTPDAMYFFNTPFFPQKEGVSLLNSYVTRAQLAFFIARLKKAKLSAVDKALFSDVSTSHWAASAIQYCVYNQYMTEFPDGKFNPDGIVENSEYIITMVKALDLPLNQKSDPLPFKDVSPLHWTHNYVKTAYLSGLIPAKSQLLMGKKLTQHHFIKLVLRLQNVKSSYKRAASFETGFVYPAKHLTFIQSALSDYV